MSLSETEQEFNASNYCWSVDKFIHLDELHNPWNAFIVNDTCIIKARIISVSEHGYERLINQEVSKMDSPAQPISVKEISLVPSCVNLCVNLVDFRGLGKLDKICSTARGSMFMASLTCWQPEEEKAYS